MPFYLFSDNADASRVTAVYAGNKARAAALFQEHHIRISTLTPVEFAQAIQNGVLALGLPPIPHISNQKESDDEQRTV